jgi:hypothetical protein
MRDDCDITQIHESFLFGLARLYRATAEKEIAKSSFADFRLEILLKPGRIASPRR